MEDVSRLRTADGREVEWVDQSKWIWLRPINDGRPSLALVAFGFWSAGNADDGGWMTSGHPATSVADAQRQAVAYLLSTGELVQAGPAREELLERALRECVSLTDALIVRNGSAEDKTLSDAEAVLRGENPWADEETP